MVTVLVADDEKSMVEMLDIMLTGEGYRVITAANTDEAVRILEREEPNLVISDMKIPKDGGTAVLSASMKGDRFRPVIMITAYASAESAVEAMKLGACDYITKPFNVEELKLVVKNALEKRGLILENMSLKTELRQKSGVREMIGGSKALDTVRNLVVRVADTPSTVLITGESGTGKELVARALHANSPRCNRPFLSINCGAMPEQLLESELFGYKKGAFTGAAADKVGLLEAADGGSFFFDEIGEMPPSLQVKLVRVLQEREIRRVGDTKNLSLDVRFIAATNKNLAERVKSGHFREDLFYRLNVVVIHLPPLRERMEDVPALANHFLAKLAAQNGRDILGFSVDALRLLEGYRWPGNIRELEHAIERAVVMETDKWINPENLPDELRTRAEKMHEAARLPSGVVDMEKHVEGIEREMLFNAMKNANGSKRDAARLLNMSLRSIRYKLDKYGIK
ncbi:MAG: sigma-54-dependent Fis family transcriptional regulator [Nitrospinae bacterium]|nr:sigma-54-dependent Fis family transcriptional regulator [Nitrospinota bacterium]